MNIKRQEIEKLATLARIAIDESTIAEVTERLGSVLELVDQLQVVGLGGQKMLGEDQHEVEHGQAHAGPEQGGTLHDVPDPVSTGQAGQQSVDEDRETVTEQKTDCYTALEH